MLRSFPASIVVPPLDQRDEWLEQSLRSAVVQSSRCEVIVAHSPRVRQSNLNVVSRLMREFDNLVLTPEKPGRGFPGAINAGIGLASTDRIGLLMSDDWLDREAVERCLVHPSDIVSTGQTSYAAERDRACGDQQGSSPARLRGSPKPRPKGELPQPVLSLSQAQVAGNRGRPRTSGIFRELMISK